MGDDLPTLVQSETPGHLRLLHLAVLTSSFFSLWYSHSLSLARQATNYVSQAERVSR